MSKFKGSKKILAFLLSLALITGMMPAMAWDAFADTEDATLTSALTEAKSYTDAITINNSANDPETVVKNFKTHFTWDNEKRESSKSYLYDWSYYNGVVFEGLEYLYETTGETVYKDYVVEYMSSLIASNGTWAKCTNDNSKQCAGYNSTHGADCYKTASLLLDAYEMTGDSRYLTMAGTLYADLDTAAKSYSLSNAGKNYRHTWASDSTPDLWLDGLYMILPFRAEYAKHIGDTEELDLIVDRMQWVSDNMYDESKGLFYHAADSATSNSGTYWLRSIGWYAAAIVDIMDSMEGENLEAMKAQLVKLVDGMKACQNSSNGMWLNNMNASQSSTNPYETSGTALTCYAVMKAVNEEWLDDSYADMAIKAFKGICSEKLNGTTLKDICFKGAPGSSNSTFYDNEGKGVGPFIMFYAEVLEYVNDQQNEEPPVNPEEPETPVEPDTPVIPEEPGTHEVTVGNATIEVENVTNLAGGAVTEEDKTLIEAKAYTDYVAYDITATVPEGEKATVNIPIPAEWDAAEDELVGISVEDGAVVEIPGELSADGIYSFEVDHFSAKGVALAADTGDSVASGDSVVYSVSNTALNNIDGDGYYLIRNGRNGLYLSGTRNSNNMLALQGSNTNPSGLGNYTNYIWHITKTNNNNGYYIRYQEPNGQYLRFGAANSERTSTETQTTVNNRVITQGNQNLNNYNGAAQAGGWTGNDDGSKWNFYKVTKSTATLSVTPGALGLQTGQNATLGATVKVGNSNIALNNCTISWSSANTNVATVDNNGKVTGKADGSTNIVATVSAINGYVLKNSIVARIPVTVTSKYIVGRELTGNTPVTITEGLTPDFSDLELTLTYNDGSTEVISADKLLVTGYNINQVGTQTCTVSYDGVECGTVELIVNAKQVTSKKLLNSSITVVEGMTPDYSNVKYEISYDNGTKETFTEADGLTIVKDNYKNAIGRYELPAFFGGNEVGTVTVFVVENSLTSAVVNGNTPQTIAKNGAPDYSDIELVLTYKDGKTKTIRYQDLKFEGLNPNAVGEYDVVISYDGHEYGSVKVTVVDSTFDGKTEATDYPKYPEDGAVRINKTADQRLLEDKGVVKVELDVAGVSVRNAVDVVLVADISNSMAWYVGASGSGDANKIATGTQSTKWDEIQKSVETFIDVFLGEEGNSTNTVSFVTFGGYDKDRNANASAYGSYADSVQTHFTSYTNGTAAKNVIDAVEIRGVKAENSDTVTYRIEGMKQGNGEAQGGTNYDFAFLETAAAINQIKADYAAKNNGASYDDSNREIHIVFLTDGAPDHYNQLYYKKRSNSQFDYYALYRNNNDTAVLKNEYFKNHTVPNYATFSQNRTNGYYIPSADLKKENWVEWIKKDSLYAAEQVAAMSGVTEITSVGFDMANGGFGGWTFDLSDLNQVLKNLAGQNSSEVFMADDAEELKAFYEKKAKHMRYAGTNAVTTDIVNDSFTVQLFPTTGSPSGNRQENLGFDPTIAIKAYDLYTKADTTDTALIGTRTGVESVLEEVSFTYTTAKTEDGKTETTLTGATSTVKEGNILTVNTDGSMVINGEYFTYYRTADSIETFEWKIGNITDKEVALSYYAYLDGSMEGTLPKEKYFTNENAILEYLDIKGNYAKQEYPMPAVVWGGAVTGYEFYLVNGDGKPCDRQGNEIPFANRIVITGPYYQELYLNDEQIYYCKIEAAKVLPVGYTLYDDSTSYTVQPASGTLQGGLTISNPAAGKNQSTIEVGDGSPNYIQTHVAFGVMYNEIPKVAEFTLAPDKVVIDYGKAIKIDTMTNNTEIPDDYTATLVGFTAYTEGADLSKIYNAIAYKGELEGAYGTFSVEGGKVLYTPTKLLDKVDKIFGVVEIKKGSDKYFMIDQLYVIPATTMYYETDFAGGVFTAWDSRNEGPAADGPQDDGTIGVDQTYGYDRTYNNDTYLSNGSSFFVEGQGVTKTKSEFSFEGIGFDLISRTGEKQGAIRVDVYSDSAKTKKVKSVTVLNKSESQLELYQIPVVSINDLPYGKYYVTIGVNAAYNNPSLPQLSRGGEFYFDAIRVYNPTAEKIATDAYRADGEYNMSLIEVRGQLINSNDYDLSVETPGVTFVDSTYRDGNPTGSAGSVDIGQYASIGPNNEVYLEKGQAIAFKINWTGAAPKSIDIGAKSITGGTAHMKAYISKDVARPEGAVVDENIESSTVQFKNLVNADNAAEFNAVKEAYVFVTNEGESVLSVTDIKVAFGNIANTVGEVSLFSNARTLTFARACVAPEVTPEEPETPDVPDTPATPEEPETDKPDSDEQEKPVVASAKIVSVKTDKKTYTQGDQVKVTVTTNTAATKVKVGTKTLKTFKTRSGNKTWTTTVKASKIGKLSIGTVAYNQKGTATKKVTNTVTVKQFAPKTFNVTLNKSKVEQGDNYTVTVKTGNTVKYVKVNGKKITKYTYNKKTATKTFKATYKADKLGKRTVKVVAYNKAGYASKAKSKTVTVKQFAPKTFNVTLNKSKVKKGEKYTVTVKTSASAKYVKVNGKKITKFTTKKGVKTFKATYKAGKVGRQQIKVVAYNKAGYSSKAKSKTLTVKK